jgi:predicted nucleic acid-binding protein
MWPAQVPSVVLAEVLTGDHRRDFAANRLLRTCQVRDVDETLAREAARLRTATGRAGTISAVDAVVAALAGGHPAAVVLTTDPDDLRALVEHAAHRVTVAPGGHA